jgi:cyclin H
MDYQKSTHISSWKFTTGQIEELRIRNNNRTRRLLLEEFTRRKEKQEKNTNDATAAAAASSSSSSPLSHQLPISFAKGYGKKSSTNGTDDPTAMDIDKNDADTNADTDKEEVKETEELPFLTPAEEVTLVNFYETKIFSLIGPKAQHPPLRRDVKVASTAALLLRRFYLSNSVMLYDPKVFMVACVFLATKIEDATVNIRYLEEGTKLMKAHVTIPEIIKTEIQLAAGIDYDLFCLHPYKPVEAYTEDLRTFLKSKEGRMCVNRDWVGSSDLRPLYDEARRIVEELVVTDVPLIATAGGIGLASLILANERLIQSHTEKNENEIEPSNTEESDGMNREEKKDAIKIDFREYLKMRFGSNHKESDINKTWDEMDELCKTIRQLKENDETDMVVLKGIHKKLKKCRSCGEEKKKKKKKRKRTDGD